MDNIIMMYRAARNTVIRIVVSPPSCAVRIAPNYLENLRGDRELLNLGQGISPCLGLNAEIRNPEGGINF